MSDGVSRDPLPPTPGPGPKPNPNPNGGDGEQSKSFPAWAVILILIFVLCAVGGAVYFYLKKRKQRLQENLAEYNQLEGTKVSG